MSTDESFSLLIKIHKLIIAHDIYEESVQTQCLKITGLVLRCRGLYNVIEDTHESVDIIVNILCPIINKFDVAIIISHHQIVSETYADAMTNILLDADFVVRQNASYITRELASIIRETDDCCCDECYDGESDENESDEIDIATENLHLDDEKADY
jgi:hypothetical protein